MTTAASQISDAIEKAAQQSDGGNGDGGPQTGASPSPSASPSATPSAKPTDSGVTAAEDIRQAVTQNSRTAGGVVNTLDDISVNLAHTRVSLWDVIVVLFIIALVWVLARVGSKVATSLLNRATKLDLAQRLLAEKLVTILVWTGSILLGIDLLGIDLTALAFFSGAFGLAIGFGLQKTFGNLIAGIILLMDRSIKPGDVIAIADNTGKFVFGQIRKIGIRAVSLTTRDEREYLIPNENLMINQVENWSYSSKNVRIQVPVGISYNCDIEAAEKLMLQAANDARRVLKTPPPVVWLDGYGDSSVDFVIQCWINDPEEGVGNVKSDVLKRLWRLFQEEGIEIPFPQRDLNLRTNEQFEQLVAAIAQRVEKPAAGAADGGEATGE